MLGFNEIPATSSTKRLLSHEISPHPNPNAACRLDSRMSKYMKHETLCVVGILNSLHLFDNAITRLLVSCPPVKVLRSPEPSPAFFTLRALKLKLNSV